MNTERLHLLIVEDEEAHVEAIRRAFDVAGVKTDIHAAGTLREYREYVAAHPPDITLIDLNLPDGQAMDVLTYPPETALFPILVMTAFGNQEIVVQVMKAGALDYVVKSPEAFAAMPNIVERVFREWKLLQNRKRAEETLRSLSSRQQALLSAIPDIVMEVDRNKVYTWTNQAGIEFFGEDVIGKEASFYFMGEQETYIKAQPLFNGDERAIYVESWQRRKDGEKRLLAWWCRVLKDAQGHVIGALSTARDVTEHKQLEDKFLRAQRLESIGALASGIAHDLNNVLMPIGIGVDMLCDKLSDAEDRETLDMMQQSVKRGADIIKQILTFACGMKGERGQVQLRYLIGDMMGVMKETFPKMITIASTVSQDLWPVMGDATQLVQVLMNLCVNARDAISKGGTLTIHAENHVVDDHFAGMNTEARAGLHVLLSVKDTGSGIPPEVLPNIFDPFFTTKEIGKGTGLGLATVNGIVKDHGGFITVQTGIGRGTEFRVYLPADAAKETTSRVSAAAALPQGRGELVLVVDDEVAIAQIMKATLEHNGYQILLAGDGAQAVAVFAEHKSEIGAVVMDIGLPVMDGNVTASAMRRIVPVMPILMMTGSSANASEMGRDDIVSLRKPFSKEKLLIKLRLVLDEKAVPLTMIRQEAP